MYMFSPNINDYVLSLTSLQKHALWKPVLLPLLPSACLCMKENAGLTLLLRHS